MEERDVWRQRSYLNLYSGGRGYFSDHRKVETVTRMMH